VVTRATWKRLKAAKLLMSGLLITLPVAVGAKEPPRSNPVGAGWQGKVEKNQQGQRVLTPEQMTSIAAVNDFFKNIKTLSGRFSQTNPDKKVQRGKFYIMRPGRFRFEYNRPSRQIIVSDGKLMAIQDLDLETDENYPLDNTPFRILLREDVDLVRDAKIMAVDQNEDQIAVTLTDKSPDSPGEITIYLSKKPAHELAGWVTTDVQGGITKVQVSDLNRPETLDKKLFVREKLFMKSLRQQ